MLLTGFVIAAYLAYFVTLVSFFTTRKYQKTSGFLIVSGDVERDQWHEMSEPPTLQSRISSVLTNESYQ